MISFHVRMVRFLVISRDGSLLVHYYCYSSRPRFFSFLKVVNWVGRLIGISIIMDHVTRENKSEMEWRAMKLLRAQKKNQVAKKK